MITFVIEKFSQVWYHNLRVELNRSTRGMQESNADHGMSISSYRVKEAENQTFSTCEDANNEWLCLFYLADWVIYEEKVHMYCLTNHVLPHEFLILWFLINV